MEEVIKTEFNLVIRDEDIDAIMGMAVHGIGYWCDEIKPVGKCLGEDVSKQIGCGGRLWLHVINENGAYHYLTRERLMIGLKKYLKNPTAGDFLEVVDHTLRVDVGYIDEGIADAIIQYALFDKVIFQNKDGNE